MKINVTIEIDDNELKKLFKIEEYPKNSIREFDDFSQYAKVFDDGCVRWTKEPEYNLTFLKNMQDYCNGLLKTKGHLFLNEVYDKLGIPRTKAGAVVGWIYNEKSPIGDNFVDFGIRNERNNDFVNGYTSDCILDFNVDGNILDYIE